MGESYLGFYYFYQSWVFQFGLVSAAGRVNLSLAWKNSSCMVLDYAESVKLLSCSE